MTLKERYRKFREWQEKPYEVAPMTHEQHRCLNCGTEYTGNYCPRCGQSAKSGRYSFKRTVMLFLEDLEFGNRSLFRTIRDLLFRPGYLMRDYLSGRFCSYFPPFKMLFVFITLSLLVDSGLNIRFEDELTKQQNEWDKEMSFVDSRYKSEDATLTDQKKDVDEDPESAKKKIKVKRRMEKMFKGAYQFVYGHFTSITLLWIMLLSIPLYLTFRHSPVIRDLKYTEFFLALVYCDNMIFIYSITSSFLRINEYLDYVIVFLPLIPLKQFSGYSFWNTILRYTIAMLLVSVLIALLFFLGIVIVIFYTFFLE